VDDLVVLEIVQERARGRIRIAGEEDCGPGHPVRRLRFEAAHEVHQRDLLAARFLGQYRGALAPGQHDQDQHAAIEDRHPPAAGDLQAVRSEKRAGDHDEGAKHGDRGQSRPVPAILHDDDPQHRIDHHGRRDGDPIG
jgi:hypothetical protein